MAAASSPERIAAAACAWAAASELSSDAEAFSAASKACTREGLNAWPIEAPSAAYWPFSSLNGAERLVSASLASATPETRSLTEAVKLTAILASVMEWPLGDAASKPAAGEGGFQLRDRRLTRRLAGVSIGGAIFQRGGEKPVRGRVDAPLRRKGEEARHGERIERLVPGPAGIGDDVGDQAVEVDFPA